MNILKTLDLRQGPVQYSDTGSGEPILFLHGAMLSARLWRNIIPKLERHYRCIAPTLPMGGHTLPMPESADLSPQGQVQVIMELMDRLQLPEVTVVANDTGGALAQFLMNRCPERLKKVVLTNCDAFEIFPPRQFQYLVTCMKWPPFVDLMALNLRIPFARNLPFTLGDMSVKPLEIMDEYLQPLLNQKAIRRDLRKLFIGIHPRDTQKAAEGLPRFQKPVLVVWGKKDRLFPQELGRRLAAALPKSQLIWLENSKTLVPEDQPELLTELVHLFMEDRPLPSGSVQSGTRSERTYRRNA
ncbi:alpha/beta fold hydrolase [Deinococcus cellulosilyticus]|nr:alpha/beta hydrolase [Deinococcus cellulosilyticus]